MFFFDLGFFYEARYRKSVILENGANAIVAREIYMCAANCTNIQRMQTRQRHKSTMPRYQHLKKKVEILTFNTRAL